MEDLEEIVCALSIQMAPLPMPLNDLEDLFCCFEPL